MITVNIHVRELTSYKIGQNIPEDAIAYSKQGRFDCVIKAINIVCRV